MKFNLGKDFQLPEEIITETTAVLGIRGSGKTTTAKVIVEEALKRNRQVAIIDPTDAWWGLKSGFKIYVFGGAHGDLPLEESQGKILADFIVDNSVSVVLSLRHLRKAAQKRLITAFNEQLYHRKGEANKRTPILVVIDECDSFIPQKVMGEDAKSVGAVEDLVRRGRNAGIGVVLISQRAASINKDVLTQLTVLIAHKHTSPQDRKALEEWIRGHDTEDRAGAFLTSLAALPTGIAWVWSPDLDIFEKVKVRISDTFDSSATPKLGIKLSIPKTLKAVDLELLKQKMKEVVELQEANDPSKLKSKVRALEQELAKKDKWIEFKPDPKVVKENISLLNRVAELEKALVKIKHLTEIAPFEQKNILRENTTYKTTFKDPPLDIIKKVAVENTIKKIELSSGVKRMLIVLAQRDPNKTTRKQLAIIAGLKQSSGTFSTYLSSLKSSKFIEEDASGIFITEIGWNCVGDFEGLPTGKALYQYWRLKLGPGEARILDVIWDHQTVTADSLPSKAGFSENSGSFSTYISKLRSLGLINKINGAYQIAEELL